MAAAVGKTEGMRGSVRAEWESESGGGTVQMQPGEGQGDPRRGALPGRRRPRGGRRPGHGVAPAGGPHRSVTAEKRRKRKIESVFSSLLKIAILTNLEADFGKTPIE